MPVQTSTTPAPATPAFINNTQRDAGTRYLILGQDIRDLGLLAFDKNTRTIAKSLDDGVTYFAYSTFVFPGTFLIQHIAHMPDGEVIIGTSSGLGSSGQIGSSVWRSTGWGTPATATFAMTFALNQANYFAYGAWSVRGNIAFISEYGSQTSVAATNGTAAAERAWLSTDGGRTFAKVFELSTVTVEGEAGPWGGPTRQQHTHGCAYDPVWDRLWLTVGDGSGSTGVTATIYSDDRGATWKKLYASQYANWQSMGGAALQNAVVFGSDFDASGLRLVRRLGYRQHSDLMAGHVFDHNIGIQTILTDVYRAPGLPNAPWLFPQAGVGAKYPGGVIATFDEGLTFCTLYTDPNVTGAGMNYKGAQKSIGPTNTGRYVTYFNDATRYPNGSVMVSELSVPKPATATATVAPVTEVFVPATSMAKTNGTPTEEPLNSIVTWRMKGDVTYGVSAVVDLPKEWTGFHIDAVWGTVTGVSGLDVAWRAETVAVPSNPATGATSQPGTGTIVTAPATAALGILTTTRLRTAVTIAAGSSRVLVVAKRAGADAADTEPGDVYFVGLKLTKV